VNNLLRQAASAASRGVTESAAALPVSTRGPATRVVASEAARLTQAAIDELPERDRELVVLRGIEQRPNDEVARLLGLTPNAASQAYRRALARLRARLPDSVFGEL
jgi:RNA polymerase sigma factor (sigma-70 family)